MAEEPVEEQTGTPAEAEPQAPESREEPPSLEDVAREIGWTPDEEKSAAQYIKATQRINSHLKSKVTSLESKLDDMAANVTQMIQRQLAAERVKWEQERDAAIESGDKAKVRQADDELKRLDTNTPAKDPRIAILQEKGAEFLERNRGWWNQNLAATLRVQELEERALRNPPQDVSRIYDAIEDVVKREFPELFTNPHRDRPSTVSGDRPPGGGKKTAWDRARAANPGAEQAFADLVEMGIYRDKAEHRERYARKLLEMES